MEVKMFNRGGQSAGKTSKRSIGYYLSGFADGEGSFNISLICRKQDYKKGWKVSPSFNISQKDDTIPLLFMNFLECGKIRYRKDGICYFEVRKISDLYNKVIPFFDKYPLLSKDKKSVFRKFSKIIFLMKEKKHLEKDGLKEILEIREKIKVKRKRKYSKKEILKNY